MKMIHTYKCQLSDKLENNIGIYKEIDDFVHRVVIDKHHDIILLIKEACTNSIKHSCGTHFKLTVLKEDNGYTVEVVDDGIGYDYTHFLDKAKRGETVDWESNHGRGIFIIYQYTDGRVVITDNGRRIRFSLV